MNKQADESPGSGKTGPFAVGQLVMENLTYTSKEAARPLVSIIVRTKDRPKRLTNALNSIARQDYPNIEVVVVNDGGQDVAPIVEDCLKNFSFNYVFLENSRGRAGAANAGLNAANGDYLNFLDDDDALYPDHIASLVSCILETGCSVAYSNILSVYFDGAPETPETPETPGSRVKEEEVFNRAFDPIRLLVENYLPIMSVLFSKAVLLEAAGFCEALDLFEDWDFWIRVSQHFHFCHLDKTTGEYRFYENDSMEGLHRRKYSYDESRAKVYDRVLPLLDGKRLVSAFNLFHREIDALKDLLGQCEADRKARLDSIEELTDRLTECENDRAERLKVIRRLEKQQPASGGETEQASPDVNAPGVSIIIPTLNGGEVFKACLESISRQAFAGPTQLIVIDSGSTDNTLKWAEAYGAEIIRIRSNAFHHARTRNFALAHAVFDMVIFMVQDAVPYGNLWLAHLAAALKENDVVAVHAGHIPHDGASVFARFEAGAHNRQMGDQPQIQSIQAPEKFPEMPYELAYHSIRLNNVCAIYYKSALLESPFPDVDYAEDMAWAKGQLIRGNQIMYQPAVRVKHSHDRPAFYRFKREVVNALYCARIMGRVKSDLSGVGIRDLVNLTVAYHTYINRYRGLIEGQYGASDKKHHPADWMVKQLAAAYPMRNRLRFLLSRISHRAMDGNKDDMRYHWLQWGKDHVDNCMHIIQQDYAVRDVSELFDALAVLSASVLGKLYGDVYASHELKNGHTPQMADFMSPYVRGI